MNILLVRILKKINLIKFFNLKLNIRINTQVFQIPLFGTMGLENIAMRESWFTNILKVLLEKTANNSVFVDVGANVGQTLIKFKSINNNMEYIGFEPNPACMKYLYALVEMNRFENISLYTLGLSLKNEIQHLYADNIHASGASVIKDFRKKKKIVYTMNVSLVRGDDFFINLEKKIGLVKIDVEGFESDVLIGLEETIRNHKPLIICEVLPVYSISNTTRLARQKTLEEFLSKINYRIFLIDEIDSSLTRIAEIGIHGDMNKTNYLFCHKDEVNKIVTMIKES